jgi:hypothetical protein
MSGPKTIDRLYAWVVTEADGGEGVPAIGPHGDGLIMPLVGSDLDRIESLRAWAMQALGICLKLQLVEFSARRVLETHVNPDLHHD